MRISLIINPPDAPTTEAVREQVARLRALGHEVHPRMTFEAGDARRMAREAAVRGADLLIIGGGDGTVNEVVNGVHEHLRAAAGGEAGAPRLAVVPLGTANDLATALGIPTDVPAAVDEALQGRALTVDVGVVEGRCFLNVSTGGIGAEATEEAPEEAKRALGRLAYLITGVKKFVALEPSTARFRADELLYEGPFLLYAVGNSRCTGGGNWLTPRAELTDGLLDLCIVKQISRVEFLRLLPELRAGRHLDHPAVLYRQVRELTVESQVELSVNADGEPLNGRQFHYRISPHRLELMVPHDRMEGSGA